ncbi:hypothetical protein RI367_003683 [Sorochytrium milnesiophthora]
MSSDPSEAGCKRLQDLHVCRHCDYQDTTQSRIKEHYRQVHQHTARIKRGGVVVTVARGQDGMLRCVCGAGYTSQKYLKRHTDDCRNWKQVVDASASVAPIQRVPAVSVLPVEMGAVSSEQGADSSDVAETAMDEEIPSTFDGSPSVDRFDVGASPEPQPWERDGEYCSDAEDMEVIDETENEVSSDGEEAVAEVDGGTGVIDLVSVPAHYCPRLKLLICGHCGYGFYLEQTRQHMRNCGDESVDADDVALALATALDDVAVTPEQAEQNRLALHRPLLQAVAPVSKLKLHDGLACPDLACPYACTQSSTMDKHVGKEHGMAPGAVYPQCKVQCLFTQGEERGFFCVRSDADRLGGGLQEVDSARQTVFDQLRLDPVLSNLDKDHGQSKFVQDLGWLQYLSDVSPSRLYELCKLSRCYWTMSVRDSCRRVLAGLYGNLVDDHLRRKAFNSLRNEGHNASLDEATLELMKRLCMPSAVMVEARPWHCPLYRALVVRSLNREGGLHRPSHVTSVVAAFKHTIRVVVYSELRLQDGDSPAADVADPLRQFDQWVAEGAIATPFAMIANVGHLATTHAFREVLLPRLDWSDQDSGSVFVDSVRVRLVDIQKVVKHTVHHGRQLYEQLCFDAPPLPLEDDAQYTDKLQSYQVGYSFLNDGRNRSLIDRGQYLERMLSLSNSDRNLDFFATVAGADGGPDEVILRRSAVDKWLNKAQQLQQMLAVGVHLSGGQPGRAPELASLLACNTVGSQRSVFWCQRGLTLVTRYNKSTATTGYDKSIPRYPSPEVSILLLDYLSVIKPMEVLLTSYAHGNAAAQVHRDMIFCLQGVPWSGEYVRNVYKRAWLDVHAEGAGAPFVGFGQYRQAVKGFCRRLMPELYQQQFKYDQAWDEQAGHSATTANRHYGRSSDELTDMTEHYFRVCRHTSLLWHTLLSGEPKPSAARAMSGELEQRVAKQWDAIERIDKVVTTAMSSPPILQPPELPTRELLLQDLRQYLDNPEADFGLGQYDALVIALRRSEDMLVVLPTGGGKSLVALLPALIENPGANSYTGPGQHPLCTVIIVPLVALQAGWLLRAAKVNCGMHPTWPPKYDGDGGGVYPVYIVGIEEACTPLFRAQLDSLYHAGRLARIVLDEAHLVTAHKDFRRHLRHIVELRVGRVPLMLLTATVAPEHEVSLKQACGAPDAVTMRRGRCTRANQQYYAMVEPDFQSAVDGVVSLAGEYSKASAGDKRWRGIVFRQCIKDVKQLCSLINAGTPNIAIAYHGELTLEQKHAAHRAWVKGKHRIMVCTDGFGAGVDYAHTLPRPLTSRTCHQETPTKSVQFGQNSMLMVLETDNDTDDEIVVAADQALATPVHYGVEGPTSGAQHRRKSLAMHGGAQFLADLAVKHCVACFLGLVNGRPHKHAATDTCPLMDGKCRRCGRTKHGGGYQACNPQPYPKGVCWMCSFRRKGCVGTDCVHPGLSSAVAATIWALETAKYRPALLSRFPMFGNGQTDQQRWAILYQYTQEHLDTEPALTIQVLAAVAEFLHFI